MEYIKLEDGLSFTIEEAKGYQWKKWDNESKRMLVVDKWEEGFQKRYFLVTDKGGLEVSSAQLGQMLESCYDKGVSNINGASFFVKTNGKQGKDVRYFINRDYKKASNNTVEEVSDMPF